MGYGGGAGGRRHGRSANGSQHCTCLHLPFALFGGDAPAEHTQISSPLGPSDPNNTPPCPYTGTHLEGRAVLRHVHRAAVEAVAVVVQIAQEGGGHAADAVARGVAVEGANEHVGALHGYGRTAGGQPLSTLIIPRAESNGRARVIRPPIHRDSGSARLLHPRTSTAGLTTAVTCVDLREHTF